MSGFNICGFSINFFLLLKLKFLNNFFLLLRLKFFTTYLVGKNTNRSCFDFTFAACFYQNLIFFGKIPFT